MTTPEDVLKLASLARISLSEETLGEFVQEFEGILAYVSALESLNLPQNEVLKADVVHNVFREDEGPHETGLYTQKIIEAFPKKEGNLLKVKQILSHE